MLPLLPACGILVLQKRPSETSEAHLPISQAGRGLTARLIIMSMSETLAKVSNIVGRLTPNLRKGKWCIHRGNYPWHT